MSKTYIFDNKKSASFFVQFPCINGFPPCVLVFFCMSIIIFLSFSSVSFKCVFMSFNFLTHSEITSTLSAFAAPLFLSVSLIIILVFFARMRFRRAAFSLLDTLCAVLVFVIDLWHPKAWGLANVFACNLIFIFSEASNTRIYFVSRKLLKIPPTNYCVPLQFFL